MTNNNIQLSIGEWMAISYIVALHFFAAVLIVKTDFIPKLKATLGFAPAPYVQDMLKYHKWMDESVPEKAAIFLGDSITQGLATAAVTPYSVNYGIGGENTAQLLDAIPSYKSLARADVIFLSIGLDDIVQGRKEGLSDRFRKIVVALPGKTPLIWSAVIPIRSKKITLMDISKVNQTISTLCANRGNCVFVDTWKFLTDKNGRMKKKLFLRDRHHLSPAGYKEWIQALKRAIQQISSAVPSSFITPDATQ